uniref:Arylsulfotransferase (ASST) n=1 Tax=Candidatus Kentrum sp. FW TaxID=2126338 RepID=A0A450SFR2_9GAMM|nr:MAG: Arylsulfotransferase (ASST) [Candidatus Kentron sp. FW]
MMKQRANLVGNLLIAAFLSMCLITSAWASKASLEFLSKPDIRANPNPSAPFAAILTFETNKEVNTRIEILSGDTRRTLSYDHDEIFQNGLPIVGLIPGAHHEIRVTISDPDGKLLPATSTVEFTTPDLPTEAEAFPIIETKRFSKTPMEPGITMFNPRRTRSEDGLSPEQFKKFKQGFGILIAVDGAGNVIWYYRGDSRISDFELLRNGNVIFLTQDYRAVEIDVLGNIVRQWYAKHRPQGPVEGGIPVDALTLHHDIDELPNGNFLVLASELRQIKNFFGSELDEKAPRKDQWIMGDKVLEFERSGKVVWSWNAFDYLDVMRIGYGTFGNYWHVRGFPGALSWTHANAVTLFDHESILVNYRFQSAITKIDRKTGDIQWIAGEPSGWSAPLQAKLLTMKGNKRWFWHQHDSKITPNGTLLLFDNGNAQARPFEKPIPPSQTRSRAVEYALDQQKMTLREKWSSIIPNDLAVISSAMGSVQYLPNTENLLVGYGLILSQDDAHNKGWHNLAETDTWTRVREYTHDSPPKVVWELTLRARDNDYGLGWTLFGARRFDHFPPRSVHNSNESNAFPGK